MHRDNIAEAARPRTNVQLVYQVFLRTAQPLDPAGVSARLPLDMRSIYEALGTLRTRGYLRRPDGADRLLYELVPGKGMPPDGRGRPRKAKRLRRVASRPISQFTAARPRRARIR